jgi:hypothetical protein
MKKLPTKKPIWLQEEPFRFEQPFPAKCCIAYDIEVFKNYFCCVVIGPKNQPTIYTLKNVRQMCLELGDNRLVLIGFNNLGYDDFVMKYIYLDTRLQLSGNLRSEFGEGDLHDRLYRLSKAIIIMKNSNRPQWYWDLWRTDLPWAFSMDTFKIPKPVMGLKERACERHTLSIEESPVSFDDPVDPKEIEGINHYCINDVYETIKEWNGAIKHVQLRQKLAEMYPTSNVLSQHDAGICEEVITQEYLKQSGLDKKYLKTLIARPGKKIDIKECLPPWTWFESAFLKKNAQRLAQISGRFSMDEDRATLNHIVDFKQGRILLDKDLFPEDEDGVALSKTLRDWSEQDGFAVKIAAGGLHSLDWPLIVEPKENELLFEIDVASFYPGLIRAMQLRPEHLSERFNEILNAITEMRLKAKAEKQTLVSEGLKIVINSAFGKTGSQYSILFDERMQLRVTLGGQISLLMLIEQLLKKGIKIVSANTDGILIHIPKSKKFIVDMIRKRWEKTTGQVLEETQYAKYVRRDVNNYLVVKQDGGTKEKGIFKIAKPEKDIRKRRNKAEILSEGLRAYFMKGISPADYVMDCQDLRKFIYSFHVGMDWRLFQRTGRGEQSILKTSRWYSSKDIKKTKEGYSPSERVGDVYKVGPMTPLEVQKYKEKNKTDEHPNNWLKQIKVENGENSAIINRLPDRFPEDLDRSHYIIAIKKMIKEIEG